MSLRLQLVLCIVTCLTLIYLVFNVRRGLMKVHYSILWVLGTICLFLIALFPNMIYKLTEIVGIDKPVNTIFLVVIFLALVLVFCLYSLVSKQTNQILRLTYKVAELEKKLEEIHKPE